MSGVKNTQIYGDVALGRNVTMGGNAHIRGSADIAHNVRIQGWLDAPNIKAASKGLFASLDALNSAYPTPQSGWWALVGDSLPAAVYRAEGGEWVATGETSGEVTVDCEQYEKGLSALNDQVADHEEVIAKIPSIIITGVSQATASTVELSYQNMGDTSPSSNVVTIPAATETRAGVMSATDKKALADLIAGGGSGSGSVASGIKEIEIKGNTSILDDYKTDSDKLQIYRLLYDGMCIGFMFVSSDQMGHGTDQTVLSNIYAGLDGKTTGILDGGHVDGAYNIIHRYYNKDAATITEPEVGTWSAWIPIAGSTLKEAIAAQYSNLKDKLDKIESISDDEIDTICT